MNKIIEKAIAKKGQFASVQYEKVCKVLKNAPEIKKYTYATNVRIGAEYDALKTTLENKGVDNKEEAHKINQGLNGMEYIIYPIILKGKNDKKYLRIETTPNTKFETAYMMDNKIVSKSEIEMYLQASEKRKSGDLPTVMNIGLDTITDIR
jgi:hypothetical protein